MKSIVLLFVFLGSARYCTKVDHYQQHLNGLNNEHPPFVHRMEGILGEESNSDDSAVAEWASAFWKDFERDFNLYAPDPSVMRKLFALDKSGIEIKVIGGNWCDDTRREIPRLCKVLHLAGYDADKFYYYQVDKAKLPLSNDFAESYKVSRVPAVVVFRDGKEIGKVLETPKSSWEKDLLDFQ